MDMILNQIFKGAWDMKKLLVYPLNQESISLVRYKDLLIDYDEVIPIASKSMKAIEGKDISIIDGGSLCGVGIDTDFETALSFADSVLFVYDEGNKDNINTFLETSKNLGKRVYVCNGEAENNLPNCRTVTCNDFDCNVESTERLKKITVPVVMVFGQGQFCNKFDIQVGLNRKFKEHGYDVSQVATKAYSTLFGFHALPKFESEPLWKRVMLYNHYFADIVDKENPDVLVVGVPGGIMEIDDWHNELFGETAIALAKSLRPDISLLSIYNMTFESDYIKEIDKYSKYALGVSYAHVQISNTKLVFEPDLKTINYLFTDSTKVNVQDSTTRYSLFNVFDNVSSDKVYENVVQQLQKNIDAL